jgi:hypothetical protein
MKDEEGRDLKSDCQNRSFAEAVCVWAPYVRVGVCQVCPGARVTSDNRQASVFVILYQYSVSRVLYTFKLQRTEICK